MSIPTLSFMYLSAVRDARQFIERPRPLFKRASILERCKEQRNAMIAEAALTPEQRIVRDAELHAARLKWFQSLSPRQQAQELHGE